MTRILLVGDDYLRLEDVAQDRLCDSAQYVGRFMDGSLGCPNLGEGLRFIGDSANWDRLRIHKDDVDEFIRRYSEYKEEKKRELLKHIRSIKSVSVPLPYDPNK